jgi:hypothetical protein
VGKRQPLQVGPVHTAAEAIERNPARYALLVCAVRIGGKILDEIDAAMGRRPSPNDKGLKKRELVTLELGA